MSGFAHRNAFPLPGEVGPHARASAAFLTGMHAKRTEGPDLRVGVSVDQIAAKALGQYTQLPSLEVSLDSSEFAGTCDIGYSCTYVSTLSWRDATTPLPMEHDPRAVFERLFGDSDSTDPSVRRARDRKNRSLLDSLGEKVSQLQRSLGSRDRTKLNDYLESVREVERRIQKAEAQNAVDVPEAARPAGVPATFDEHAKLMFDLQLLAYQCDITRVCTFMTCREVSSRVYPEIGVADPHHSLSHHGNDPEKIAQVAKINAYHTKLFGYYLDRLKSTPDGDGSLLDHVAILYGSGISDGNRHLYDDLPILLAGSGAGRIRGGRHLRFKKDTPLANLFVTMLHDLGVPVDHLGDSTGELDYLTSVAG
jgi:hypothetical protein